MARLHPLVRDISRRSARASSHYASYLSAAVHLLAGSANVYPADITAWPIWQTHLAELLPTVEQVLGPDTLLVHYERAQPTGRSTNKEEATAARDRFTALLADSEKLLGGEHPDTRATERLREDWRRRSGVPDDYWSYPQGQ